MSLFQGIGRRVENEAVTTPNVQGLAAWILSTLASWRSAGEAQQKQMRLIETLPLGGKRELMLVSCAGESFLVGSGAESIQTIVRLQDKNSLSHLAKNLDEAW